MDEICVAMADDSINFCESLKDYFDELNDISLTKVLHDGLETVDYLKENDPDVLLLDIVMPNLDGIGVLKTIRSQDPSKKTKIIIVSALGQERITRKALDLGADFFVVKPFDFPMLADRIREEMRDDTEIKSFSEDRPFFTNGSADKNFYPSLSAGTFGVPSGFYREPILQEANQPLSAGDPSLERTVSRLLHDMGVPAHIKGYLYLKEGISLIYQNVEMIGAITKEVYPRIAEKFATSPTRVERAIRHAIEVSWNRGQLEFLHEVFGYTINMKKGKPTNGEFMAMLADKIRMDFRK